jgi:DUF2924 family protein
MRKTHRNGASSKGAVEDEIAHLRGLDLRGLRARWQGVFQGQAPTHLTRHLLLSVIAYRLQADRFGDLDHATRQVLDRTVAKGAEPAMSARLANFDQKQTEDLRLHRQRLIADLQARQVAPFDFSRPLEQLKDDLAAVEAGLAELDGK